MKIPALKPSIIELFEHRENNSIIDGIYAGLNVISLNF
jgi:hypothetical protein